ncbi:hypothetical protein BBG48_005405 [Criibacterium bergeronii]|uniref:Uncharacterized protein n=1 Tax=Criibacterium bergeronii TaxID=1871336 RepID=A0A371ILL3_9FIRM|nr:hypothetical protein BBG48_005405 [Criibacterium bergeronii]
MSMIPNYIIALISLSFLVYSFVNLVIKKVRFNNPIAYLIGVIVALILVSMSIYGIIFNIPLGQVQAIIEANF